LSANSNFYNLTLGAAMFLGRFVVALAVLAIAGNLAAKKDGARFPWNSPHQQPHFRLRLVWGDRDYCRADFLSCLVPRPDCRARPDARGPHFLTTDSENL
jgi:hypothetical protein